MLFSRILFTAPALVVLFFLHPVLSLATDADALAISQTIQARHLPYGTIMDPVYAAADSNQITEYTRCGDSAIWTGHYLAAEAFRYRVTRAPDALANVKSAISGIQSLIDVTGADLLARCRFPADSPYAASIIGEESHNGIYLNAATGDNWVGNVSRDQYSGVFFGLAVAYDMVDDTGVQSAVSTQITRMLDYLRSNNWTLVMPDNSISTTFIGRADQQISFVTVGANVNPAHYANASELSSAALAATVPAPIGLEVTSNDSYFKFNLDAINLFNLVRLDNGPYHGIYTEAFTLLWKHVDDQENAFFNMINRALYPTDLSHDTDTVAMLQSWLQRPTRDVYVDLTGTIPFCNAPDEACNPVPVAERPTTDFLWQRSPYDLQGGGQGTIESAGIDYILPYWMARYYGVASSATVINATSASSTVAAETIATFYGPSLAAVTAEASTLPPPQTLGGVSVQVTDAAGGVHSSALFYVSPTQINFEIPAGTALGLAVIDVIDSGGTRTSTSTANIAAVAPGLFVVDTANTAATTALTSGSDLYLTLYGTGIRNRSSLAGVSVTIGETSVPVLYAGPQGSYDGLDQVNVSIPQTLRGTGLSRLVLTVDGQTAASVYVIIQ